MDSWSVEGSGNDLHWLGAGAVAADVVQVTPSVHEIRLPAAENRICQRDVKMLVKVHHHFRDTGLGGGDFAVVGAETEVSTDGGLEAVAVEDLALDL